MRRPVRGLGRPRELRAASAAYNTFFQASRCVRVLGVSECLRNFAGRRASPSRPH